MCDSLLAVSLKCQTYSTGSVRITRNFYAGKDEIIQAYWFRRTNLLTTMPNTGLSRCPYPPVSWERNRQGSVCFWVIGNESLPNHQHLTLPPVFLAALESVTTHQHLFRIENHIWKDGDIKALLRLIKRKGLPAGQKDWIPVLPSVDILICCKY